MSVSGCFEQICIGVDELAAKPALEQMTPAAVAPVERVGIRTMKNMDCSRNVGNCGLQNEMEVSGHQRIGEKPQFLRPDGFGKKREVGGRPNGAASGRSVRSGIVGDRHWRTWEALASLGA